MPQSAREAALFVKSKDWCTITYCHIYGLSCIHDDLRSQFSTATFTQFIQNPFHPHHAEAYTSNHQYRERLDYIVDITDTSVTLKQTYEIAGSSTKDHNGVSSLLPSQGAAEQDPSRQ